MYCRRKVFVKICGDWVFTKSPLIPTLDILVFGFGTEWNGSIPAEWNGSILVFGLDNFFITEPFYSCVWFWNGVMMEWNEIRLIIHKLD